MGNVGNICIIDNSSSRIIIIPYHGYNLNSYPLKTYTPFGIILSNSYNDKTLIISLEEKIRCFGGYKYATLNENSSNGLENTNNILKNDIDSSINYSSNQFIHPAAYYCQNYLKDKTNNIDWFLPSIDEIKLLRNNLEILNQSISKINEESKLKFPLIDYGKTYLTSNEFNICTSYAYTINESILDEVNINEYCKYSNGFVRAFGIL